VRPRFSATLVAPAGPPYNAGIIRRLPRPLLPEAIERGRKRPVAGRPRVRLWSVACSTGQEPYSLAMVVQDFLHDGRAAGPGEVDFRILGTDVSARVLAVAAAGEYPRCEVARGMTPEQVERSFTPRGRSFRVREEVRRLVEFRRVNLVQSLAGLGTFDGIFCRNVLIYFDEATRRRVSEQLAALPDDGGWLVLGAAENLYGISERFETLAVGTTLVYRKRVRPSRDEFAPQCGPETTFRPRAFFSPAGYSTERAERICMSNSWSPKKMKG
jgi:chemotaxis protein methyltransferase CheR